MVKCVSLYLVPCSNSPKYSAFESSKTAGFKKAFLLLDLLFRVWTFNACVSVLRRAKREGDVNE